MRLVFVSILTSFLVSCASTKPPSGVDNYKVGRPYEIRGVWYRPKVQPNYNKVGVASWYGPGFHGKKTANGETYNQNALTAAHTTLPMPSNVRVTNLDNGRSIVVRINDRGPFAHKRIIDLSARAADLLGFKNKGTARVRVQVLGPADDEAFVMAPAKTSKIERTAAMAAPTEKVAEATLEVPAGARVAPVERPDITPAQRIAFSVGEVYLQVGAFTDSSNAVALYNEILGLGKVSIASRGPESGPRLYHVRLGPVSDEKEAERLMASLRARGHETAQIVVE